MVKKDAVKARILQLRENPEGFLIGTSWLMRRVAANGTRTPIYRRITLAKDGTIQGANNPNDSFWRVEGGKLLFLNKKKVVTTIFDKSFGEFGKLGVSGKHQQSPAVHQLVAVP